MVLRIWNRSVGSIPTLASKPKRLFRNGLEIAGVRIFTGIFTCLAPPAEHGLCSVNAGPLLPYCSNSDRFTLATVSEAMNQQFELIKRPWGVYYLKNKVTGEQTTLKTRDKDEARLDSFKPTTTHRTSRTSTSPSSLVRNRITFPPPLLPPSAAAQNGSVDFALPTSHFALAIHPSGKPYPLPRNAPESQAQRSEHQLLAENRKTVQKPSTVKLRQTKLKLPPG
jgi:hypothetical protein